MPYNLVIVESPAKARTIEKFLGKDFKVVASNGHVRDLPKSTLGIDVENNFEPKYIRMSGRKEIVDMLKKEVKGAKAVYLATDPDREGEAISWHLSQLLNLNGNAKRITFNEITKTAVKKAIESPREIDQKLVDAQQARRVLDRLVGYKLSPVLWAKVRSGLSAGRVQSVATRLIVDREREIEEFVPREFWTIDAVLHCPKGKKKFEAKFYGTDGKKDELDGEAETNKVLETLKGAEYVVREVKPGEKTVHAPAPFTTSQLQQEAVRKLNFTAKKTMLIAQMLYEGVEIKGQGALGLITYIRTDSVRVSNEAQEAALKYIESAYGKDYVPEKPNVYKGRKNTQDAHEAIRPTYIELTPESIKDSLTNEQYRLYKLIYTRFLASQMSTAVYKTQAIRLEAAGYVFKASRSQLVFPGFTKAYSMEGSDEEKSASLLELNPGDVCPLEELKPEQHFTQPPPRYTEATLVRALEDKGIGRPSTYAPIISTIIERRYVVREGKTLMPTELGKVVTDLMRENFANIVDVGFTAKMEEDLDEIEEGRKQWRSVVGEFYQPFIEEVENAEKQIERVELPVEVSDVQCEKCGAMMVYKEGRYGRFLACPNYPECKNTKPVVEKIDTPCPKCGGDIIVRKTKKGKTFYGCANYPACDFVSWDLPAKGKCSRCGAHMVWRFGKIMCADRKCKASTAKSEG